MSHERVHPLTLLKRVRRKLKAKRRHFVRAARRQEEFALGGPKFGRPKPAEDDNDD